MGCHEDGSRMLHIRQMKLQTHAPKNQEKPSPFQFENILKTVCVLVVVICRPCTVDSCAHSCVVCLLRSQFVDFGPCACSKLCLSCARSLRIVFRVVLDIVRFLWSSYVYCDPFCARSAAPFFGQVCPQTIQFVLVS